MASTKQGILNKAFALFLTVSYRDVTLSKLLKETGISKGAFYHHFSSKEELFTDVAEQFFFGASPGSGFRPSPNAGFIVNMNSLLDKKQQAFEWFAGKYKTGHKEFNFFMFIAEAIRYLPGVREKVTILVDNEISLVREILGSAQDNGELKPGVDINFMAGHIVRAFDGYEMHGVLLGQSAETVNREKEMVMQIWELIKKR
ncbi:MAG: TetR/AcrR family transcriptional regulator [Marinilabiliales bacterium]|nr:MAG: TetR/AcrR family transcriptional regulator [Marinilabiliales bacterium]